MVNKETKHKRKYNRKGSNTRVDKYNRLMIGVNIIRSNSYQIRRRTFATAYREAVRQAIDDRIINSVTDSILSKDILEIKELVKKEDARESFDFIDDRTAPKVLSRNPNLYIEGALGNTPELHLKEIRIESLGKDCIIFKKNEMEMNKIDYPSVAMEVIKKSLFIPNDEHHICHIYLIYDHAILPGTEEYFSSFFSTNFYNLLYVNSHRFCTELVCDSSDLQNLIKNIWRVFKKIYA